MLRDIVAEAHRGTQFPQLKVLAGGTLFVGYLGTKEQAQERFEYGLGEAIFDMQNPRKKTEAQRVFPKAKAEAKSLTEALPNSGDDSTFFSLLNCHIWPPSGGDGVEVAAVQLRFDAIEGWWLGASKRLPRKSGSGLFAGILLPVSLPS
jgi:hypothetical protein